MKIEELRIGNIIKTKGANLEYWQITVEDFGIMCDKVMHDSDMSKYIPVDITKEWLIRFGFYHTEINNSYQLDSDLGFSIWGRLDSGFNIFVSSDDIGKDIKFVHELQNLFFALTKEELTLKAS